MCGVMTLVPAARAAEWDEAVRGDISDDPLAPSPLAVLAWPPLTLAPYPLAALEFPPQTLA